MSSTAPVPLALSLILTHPGGAHKDDFLACCVLLAFDPVPIARREPTEADLAAPSVAVIDVGHRHEPQRRNYDHHQLPRDHAPLCSLSLVLQHLGIYEDAKQFCDWLEPAEWFDCRGPNETARWLGVDRSVVSKLNSPIDITLLRRFAQTDRHEPGQPLWEIMRMIGEDMIQYLRTLRQRLDFIGAHGRCWTIQAESGPFTIFFLPRFDSAADESADAVPHYIHSQGLESRVVGIVYPDRRNSGYALARFNDHPRLDFSRIVAEPDVHFAHASGFLAKSTTTDTHRLEALLRQSARPSDLPKKS